MPPENSTIPIIDFSTFNSDPNHCAEEIRNACEDIGFFYILNHGISDQELSKMWKLSEQFFDLPTEEKLKYLIGRDNAGYSAMFQEKLDPATQKKGDHKEAFNFSKFYDCKPSQSLPEIFLDNQKDILSFSKNCHQLAMKILRAFAIGLKIPNDAGGKEWFVSRHKYDALSGDITRFLKYPQGSAEDHGEQIRAGSHSDYGSITLLFVKDTPGLEVLSSQGWISAPLVPGGILVNVGDQMQYWTKGLYKSTQHRVIFLPEHRLRARYSIACFIHANDDVLLEPVPSTLLDGLKDEPSLTGKDGKIRTAGMHLRERLAETYTYVNEQAT